MPRVRERWKALLFVALLAASVLVLFASASALFPRPEAGAVRDVALRVEGPGWTITYTAGLTANGTAFAFLLEAADRSDFEVEFTRYAPPLDSVLVDSINGTRNGQGGLWWLYWVDGEYGTVGADRRALADGDEVLWAFRAYPPEGA